VGGVAVAADRDRLDGLRPTGGVQGTASLCTSPGAVERPLSAPTPVMLNAEPGATAEIHPDDAGARRIADGAEISVYNDLGRIRLTATLTDDVPAGTVAIPFGRWGADPTSGGANSLTSTRTSVAIGRSPLVGPLARLARLFASWVDASPMFERAADLERTCRRLREPREDCHQQESAGHPKLRH
jgi:hypothetical protein